MREIKFRAWDDDGGRMLTHEHENLAGDLLEAAMSGGMPIMQYTGLKDSKGREIYEGDIIHYINTKCHGWQLEETRNNFKGVVEWNDSDITFDVNSTINSIRLSEWHYECCRVIGNIYENPELLEVKL